MAEPKEEPAAPAAPAASPIAEPAVPAQADQAAAIPAPAVEIVAPAAAGAEPAKPDAPASEPTLLENFDTEKAKAEPKPGAQAAEAKVDAKPGDEKPAEIKPGEKSTEAAPALPAVDYFKDVKIPETIKVDDAQRAGVTGALDALRSGKVSEGVQQLFDLHEKTMQAYAKDLQRQQWVAFNETRKGWRTEVMADPVLGGAGHNTAMGAIARMRDLAVSDQKPGTPEYEAQRKEFETFLRVTGAGDHPAFLRMLHNFGRYFDEPPLPPEGARPPPNPGRPAGENRRARMYPSMQNGRG
jgi:hypothetical protein